jgi:predicted nucleic acid-binding protein
VILVDSSVWIDHFRDVASDPVLRLRALIDREVLLVGDLVLCEVLQGGRSAIEAETSRGVAAGIRVRRLGRSPACNYRRANYRSLRSRGVTVRTTVDLFIGTFCIERGHALLHNDRDFAPMERYLGLQAA